MKKLMSFIAGLFMVLSATAQFEKASLQATGLTCAMCSNAINKSLQTLSFVQSVRSDIKNSAFNIVFREKTDVDIDAIKKAVEDAGFAIGSLKLTGKFDEVKVENDKHIQIGNKNYHFVSINNQVLSGEKTLTVVDKDFLTAKAFRKFSAATKLKCISTGKAEACCTDVPANARMYHVTI